MINIINIALRVRDLCPLSATVLPLYPPLEGDRGRTDTEHGHGSRFL